MKGFVLVLMLLMSSCKSNFYSCDTQIEVRYEDNTKDTLLHHEIIRENDKLNFKIVVSEPTFFGSEKVDPCLVIKHKIMACGVRTFKILRQSKELTDSY